MNKKDGRLSIRAHIQLNRILGPTVAPQNVAQAIGSATGAQTLAIAMQLNLIGRNATTVTPKNVAVAVNQECSNCYTVARALQYTITVDDPKGESQAVRSLIHDMNHELQAIRQDGSQTVTSAESRIGAVIARFQQLASSLDDKRDEQGVKPVAGRGSTLPWLEPW